MIEIERLRELEERLRTEARAIREHVPDAEGSFHAVAVSAGDATRRTIAGPLHADMLDEAADTITDLLASKQALERIDKFITDYFSPWGSWKTAWWEGEVSDDVEFSDANALRHIAKIARSLLPQGVAP